MINIEKPPVSIREKQPEVFDYLWQLAERLAMLMESGGYGAETEKATADSGVSVNAVLTKVNSLVGTVSDLTSTVNGKVDRQTVQGMISAATSGLVDSSTVQAMIAAALSSYSARISPIEYDYEPGYVMSDAWNYQNSTNNHSDIYQVQSGHDYVLWLGDTVGTRFRAVVVATNPVGSTSNISGTMVVNKSNPNANDAVMFTASIDGYLAVTKDDASTTGLMSYLADIS